MGGAEEPQPPAGAEELAAQKREQRLRKFRELHLKRVSCPGGHLTLVTWPGPCKFVEEEEGVSVRVTDRQSWMKVLSRFFSTWQHIGVTFGNGHAFSKPFFEFVCVWGWSLTHSLFAV